MSTTKLNAFTSNASDQKNPSDLTGNSCLATHQPGPKQEKYVFCNLGDPLRDTKFMQWCNRVSLLLLCFLSSTILPSSDSLWCSVFNTPEEHSAQSLRLTESACWERTGCQFPFSSVVLFFPSAKALEKRRGGGEEGRNPLANDSWDLGHVLNLDTNVGSFYSPSVICFMCLPNTGTGLASLSPTLHLHLIHHV